MSDPDPLFGYGHRNRPLWSARDRDAEAIRQLLRDAGHHEFADAQDGFVVEGGDESSGGAQPFHVAWSGNESEAPAQTARYAQTLRTAGYRADPDPDDAGVLQVHPPT